MKQANTPWQTRLTESMISNFQASGSWRGISLAQEAENRALMTPNKIAVIDGDIKVTFSELYSKALKLAGALEELGLHTGDVISFQLPNWYEALIINLAASIKGFVCNPIVPIYRDAEVKYILGDAKSKVFFVPESFRSINYLDMVENIRADLPDLQEVVLLRSDKSDYSSFDSLIYSQTGDQKRVNLDANNIKLLLYTSGTTGNPKGVLHSENTIRSEIDAISRSWNITPNDVMLMSSPVTHITGYLYALELPFITGAKALLMEKWDAKDAVHIIQQHNATMSVGSTPFLIELVSATEGEGKTLSSMRYFICGGAPVPPDAVERAKLTFPNCITCRLYGSSEAPSITIGISADDPVELGATTDGRIFNHDVLIVDTNTNTPVEMGVEGEIITRGPEVMLGYTSSKATESEFDDKGYFHTGDLGFISYDNYLTISGRKKDIIIRGGENLSAKEIEDVLHSHEAVIEAAIVAAPHQRLGETPVAFIVLESGNSLSFDEMINFIDAARLAKQKFPERLYIIDEMPKTASGKIQKHILRKRCADAMH